MASEINNVNMIRKAEIEKNSINNIQRINPAKTGKDLLSATREMVAQEFSALNTKASTAQIDAIARAIVFGLIKEKEI